MKKVAILAMVSTTLIAGSVPSFAEQESTPGLPFGLFQLDEAGATQMPAKAKSRKVLPRLGANGAHWGKHHENGIHLEGSEHPARESARSGGGAPSYD